MPLDEDKYPTESGRRRFVKGVVGSAALSSLGAGGAAALDTTTGPQGAGGGQTEFFGIENTDGPAPRGMPIIPMEITSAGELKGIAPRAAEELSSDEEASGFNGSGVPYTFSWFQYCGVQSYAGISPDFESDNLFRASSSPPPGYGWQDDVEAGTVLTVDMFDDYREWGNGIGRAGIGKPAAGTWRSQGDDAQTIPIQVIRSDRVPEMIAGEGDFSEISDNVRTFLEGAAGKAPNEDAPTFLAWLDKCTHFCCVPAFKGYEGSAGFGAADAVYCQCHQSVYDPFSPVQKNFVALPRPDN